MHKFVDMNRKQLGEIGERIAIGELAKYGIDVMLPMTDNLPFDIVVFYNNKFYKCQVKTSRIMSKEGAKVFDVRTNDWYKHTYHTYTKDEVDVWILCDLSNIYLLKFDEMKCTTAISLRESTTKNNQKNGVRLASDYIISEKRISEVFN